MTIQYLPLIQIQKENRPYTLLLPFNAPYQEAYDVCLELAQRILELQKEAEELKLKQEMNDAVASEGN